MAISNSQESTAHYLNSMGTVPLMTAEEEIIMGRKVVRGQELRKLDRPLTPSEQREVRNADRAKNRFIEANLRLVVQIARNFKRTRSAHFLELTDLAQFGVFGLVRAVDKFDPSRGYKFCTYAYRWIQQFISRSINYYERQIHLPDESARCARNLPHAKHRLELILGRTATRKELAEELNVTEAEIVLILERGTWAVSLDATLSSTGMETVGSLLADPNSVGRDDFEDNLDLYREQLNRSYDILTEREHKLLTMHYGLNGTEAKSFRKIAKELKLCPVLCSATVKEAVEKLTTKFSGAQVVRCA